MFRVPVLVLAVAVLAAGCTDTQSTAPRRQVSDPSKMILDAAHHGGNPDFFFLPLIGPDARNSPNFDPGKFNATLTPVVKICKLVLPGVLPGTGATTRLLSDVSRSGCASGPPVATLTDVAVFPKLEFYLASWKTRNYSLDPDAFYRVQVFVGSTLLGFVDVTIVTSLKEAKNAITGEVVPFADDFTLPIPFRIEAGALTGGASSACKGLTPDCAEVSVKKTGGTIFTNTKWAGIQLENGWVSDEALALGGGSIQLTIQRDRSRDGNCHGGSEGGDPAALGSLYVELNGCYHYTTDPNLNDERIPEAKRGFQTDNNKVGQCTHELPTDEGAADKDYLLFKSDPGKPITPLDDVPAPVGLNCTSFAFYQGLPNNPLFRYASIKLHDIKQAISRFVVNEAYAWDGGLGGKLPKGSGLSFISRGVGLRMARTSLNNQSGSAGAPINVTVRVTTEHLHINQESRAPKAGVPVTFRVPDENSGDFGDGVPVATVFTDENGEATASWYLAAGTHTISATAATIDPTPIAFTATGVVSNILFRATFNNDQPNAPPGSPEVGTLNAGPLIDGTALVQSSAGGFETNSLQITTPGAIAGAPRVSGHVAGAPPSSGVYTVRWRSSVSSGNPFFAAVVVRSATSLILGSVSYSGNRLTANVNTDAIDIGAYSNNVPQLFELTLDLAAKTVSFSIDGVPVPNAQNLAFVQTGSADLATVSMEFGGTDAYSMAWDDIEIVAPSP